MLLKLLLVANAGFVLASLFGYVSPHVAVLNGVAFGILLAVVE